MSKAATATVGHNSAGDMSERDRKVLFHINRRNWLAAMEAKKAADAKVKLVGKAIKADLGEHGLHQIKTYEKAKTPEGQAEIKEIQAIEQQAMRFAGIPVNTQLDIFQDLAPLAERAYLAGEEAGMAGETLSNPYNEGSTEGQEYARGWHEGQAALFAGIKKKEEAEAAAAQGDELIGQADIEDDPFEDAPAEAAE